jgi:hypothetical protein
MGAPAVADRAVLSSGLVKVWILLAAVSVASFLATATVFAQTSPHSKEVVEVVLKQLEALRRDDYDTAYTVASASIHEMFDRAAFERMVRGGYPEIAHSSSACVVESRVGLDGHVYLRLKIRGSNGNNIEAVYDVIWEGGRFRISGVVAKPDLGLV